MTLKNYFILKRCSVLAGMIFNIVILCLMVLYLYVSSPDRMIRMDFMEDTFVPFWTNMYQKDGLDFSYPDLAYGISAVFALTLSSIYLWKQKAFGLKNNIELMCFHIFSIFYFGGYLLTQTVFLPLLYMTLEFFYLKLLCKNIESKTKLLPWCFGVASFSELLRCILFMFFLANGSDYVLENYCTLMVIYYVCKVITDILFYELYGALATNDKGFMQSV